MKLLISAGEASGDLHGARLLAALRRERPDLHGLRDGRGATGRGGARARGRLGKPLGRGHLRSLREASGPARRAQAAGRRGPSAPARRRDPHRLSRLPQPALPPAGPRPDPDRVLRPAAGLGLAAGPRADDRSARPAHPDALPVRDRDLPAPRRRRRLRRPPGRGGRPAGARRALAAASQDAAPAGSAARQPRRRARPPLGGDGRGSGAARAPLRPRGRRHARARPAREPLPAERPSAASGSSSPGCTRSSPPPISPSSPRARPRSRPRCAAPRWSWATGRPRSATPSPARSCGCSGYPW